MLAANTLMALACLITNKGPIDVSAVEAQLTDAEMAQVQKLIEAGSCLPRRLEWRTKETEEKIRKGLLENFSAAGNPTHDCD